MKVIEPGHIYELHVLDGSPDATQKLVFVNRENGSEHPGTQTQEVLRAMIDMTECLVDRTNHCDECKRWEGNDRIIKAMSEAQRQMRLAILYHEQRAMERRVEKKSMAPEKLPLQNDGHVRVEGELS